MKFFKTMHTIRRGCQTFARAKCNDSGAKKSQNRCSKEERKAMIESFIKEYQYSNKGDFPSPTLTHKEVGGSFYTVREIFRDIIQENRVLGPAKLTTEEQNAVNFFDQYPLGSVSMEPDIHAVSSNGPRRVITSNLSNHHQSTIESQVLESSEKCREPEDWKVDDGIIVGGSYTSERTQESGGSIHNEPPVIIGLEGEEIVDKELVTSEPKITQVAADVVVETFPIKPVTDIFALDGDSGEPRVVAGSLEENESQTMELETVKNDVILNMNIQEISSRLVDDNAGVNAVSYMSENSCILVDEKADPSLESLNHSPRESSNALMVDDDRTDLENKEILLAEVNHMSAPNGKENFNAPISGSFQGKSISEEVIAIGKKSGIQNGSSSKKSSDPPLDRINLESWGATTNGSGGPQTNSLLSFVKARITAFVKFLSK